MLRAVLLDLGHTLVYLDRPWDDVFRDDLEALYRYLVKLGFRIDFQAFTKTFMRVFEDASAKADLYKVEIPMEEILSKVFKKSKLEIVGVDLIQNAIMEYYRPEVEAWQLYPDATQTLAALNEAGLEMGLISNAKSDWAVHAILQRRGIEKFFKTVVTSAALRIRKPRPDIFVRALAALDVRPPEAVFVGDQLNADIIGARSLGMRSIHVSREPPETTKTIGTDAEVSSLSGALAQITAWRNGSLGPDAKVSKGF